MPSCFSGWKVYIHIRSKILLHSYWRIWWLDTWDKICEERRFRNLWMSGVSTLFSWSCTSMPFVIHSSSLDRRKNYDRHIRIWRLEPPRKSFSHPNLFSSFFALVFLCHALMLYWNLLMRLRLKLYSNAVQQNQRWVLLQDSMSSVSSCSLSSIQRGFDDLLLFLCDFDPFWGFCFPTVNLCVSSFSLGMKECETMNDTGKNKRDKELCSRCL